MPPHSSSPRATICDPIVAQRLARFASRAEQAIFVGAPDGSVEWANHAACRLSGFALEELIGRRVALFPDDADAQRAAADHVRARLAAGEPARLEASIRTREGRVLWIELRVTPAPGAAGERPGWVAVATDISERKRADAALAESEERYRRLVEDSPQPVAVHAEGRVVYLNHAALALLGAASSGDVVGRPIFDFLHPDYHGLAAERILKMERVGEPAGSVVETLLRVDGSPVDVELAASPIVWRGRPAIQLAGHALGVREERPGRERAPVVDLASVVLEIAPRIEDRIAPRADVTLDLCEARVALREAPAPLEELICALVEQAAAALPGGRGALLLRSERRELDAAELAAFVPCTVEPGPYLVFEACARDGRLDPRSCACLFEAGFARRFPGRGPGLGSALGIARTQGGALRVQAGGRRGVRIALALPAAGARGERPRASARRRPR